MQMGQFIKVLGFQGEKVFFRIAMVEPLAPNQSLFADSAQGVAAAAHVGAAPIMTDPDPVVYNFIEPVQELRLLHLRLSMNVVNELLGPAPIPNNYMPNIGVEVNLPESERILGTDKMTNPIMNGIVINPQVGGRQGGRLPANQIRRLSDQNEVFDLFVMHGYSPAFDIANQTPLALGGIIGPLASMDWYLNSQGRKYILGKPSKEELRGIIEGYIPYRAISLGGISSVSQEA